MKAILGIPPILYLTMNQTLSNEVRGMLLNLLGVDLNQLSEQTRAEVRRVARMAENGNNAEEMIERNGVANQITPIETI